MAAPDLLEFLLRRLESRAESLTDAWLERVLQRIPVEPRRVFPSKTIRNHMPEVMRCLLRSLQDRSEKPDDHLIIDEMERLTALRREQGYGLQELLEELADLEHCFLEGMVEEAAAYPSPVSASDAMQVALLLKRTIQPLATYTCDAYGHLQESTQREREQLLTDFGYGITHELRNRLNAVQLSVAVLGRAGRGIDGRHHKTVQSITRALGRAAEVLDDVYAITLAHGLRSRSSITPARLNDVIHQTIAELEAFAQTHSVAVEAVEPLPDFHVDIARVQLILVNLITNAIKYSDVRKAQRWVKVRAVKDETDGAVDHWRIEIQDNGKGIDSQDHELIFERMVRAVSPEDSTPGLGLGLSLVAKAAHQLGSRISVESTPDEGSCFSFTLDAERGELS